MKRCFIILVAIFILGISVISCSDKNEGLSERDDIDIDFALLSATIREAEYYKIMEDADTYIGSLIRAVGTYFPLYFSQNGKTYHYVIIVPGDDCCQIGFEFKLPGDNINPDDYPAARTKIEVIGTLSRYDERGTSYIYIAAEEVNILN